MPFTEDEARGMEADDAHGFAQTCMEQALDDGNVAPRDIVEAVGDLNRSARWLAAETRAARLERRAEANRG